MDLIIISLKINLFSLWYSWKIAELALNKNHSLTPNALVSKGHLNDPVYDLGAIFQLYHSENKLIFNEIMMRSILFLNNSPSWIFIVLSQPVFTLSPQFYMLQDLKLAVAHSPFTSKFQCGPLKISTQSSTWRVKIRKNKIV
jgi:hypothetical protein